VASIPKGRGTFFRLSPAARARAIAFGLMRGEITTTRFDVNYWRLSALVESRLSLAAYPPRCFGELAETVQYGCSKLAKSEPIGVPILRMNNLQANGWDLGDLKWVDLSASELETYRVQPEDLLFNRTNSKELVGKCEVFRESGEWVFASYLIRVRTRTQDINPQFASDFLNAPTGRLQIDQLSRQIIGMTNINAEEIKGIRIPVPAPEQQLALVAQMDAARVQRRAKQAEADALLAGLDDFLLATLGLTPPPRHEQKVFAVTRGAVPARFDPHFHLPAFAQNQRMLAANRGLPLGTIATFSNEVWKPEKHNAPTFRYIEISSVDRDTGEAQAVETPVAEAPSRARMAVHTGDIIVSLTRPHHGSIAQITPALDGCVASTGFSVIRNVDQSRVLNDYLWCILRRKICLTQMLQRASGGNYPAITEPELAKVLIPVPTMDIQNTIAAEARRRRDEARRLRAEADSGWQAAKLWFEEQLLGPEQP